VTGDVRKLGDVVSEAARVAAEFPGYCIGTQRTYGGFALVAVRRDGVAQPGVYAVITGDPAELRRELRSEPR
jgi:hypothetical protein